MYRDIQNANLLVFTKLYHVSNFKFVFARTEDTEKQTKTEHSLWELSTNDFPIIPLIGF